MESSYYPRKEMNNPKTCNEWMKFIDSHEKLMQDDCFLYIHFLTQMQKICKQEMEEKKGNGMR